MTFLIGVPSERRGEANYILETCTGVEMDIEVHLGRYEAAYRCFKNLLRKHIKRKYEGVDHREDWDDAEGRPAEP
jgi:hypothetical protein